MENIRYANLFTLAVLLGAMPALAGTPKPPEILPPAPVDNTVVMSPLGVSEGCLNYYNHKDNSGMKTCLTRHIIEDHFPNYVDTLRDTGGSPLLPIAQMQKHLMMSLPYSLPPQNPGSFDHRADMGENGSLCVLNVRRESGFAEDTVVPTHDVVTNPTMQLDGLGNYIGGGSWVDPDPVAGDAPYFPSMLLAQQTLNVGDRYWSDDPGIQPLGMDCSNIGQNFCNNVPFSAYPNTSDTWHDQSIVTENACVSLLEVEATYFSELNPGASVLVDDYRMNPNVIGCAWYAEPDRINPVVAWEQYTGETSIEGDCSSVGFVNTPRLRRRPPETELSSGFVYPYFHAQVEACGVDVTEQPPGTFTCTDANNTTVTAATFKDACDACMVGQGSWSDPNDLDPYTPAGGCYGGVLPFEFYGAWQSPNVCTTTQGTYTATYQDGEAKWENFVRGDRVSRYLGIPHPNPYQGMQGFALPGFNYNTNISFSPDDACSVSIGNSSAVDGYRAEVVWIPDDQVIDITEVRDAVELAHLFESMRTIPDAPLLSAAANANAVVGAYCYVAHNPGELCGPAEWLAENWEKCTPLQDL